MKDFEKIFSKYGYSLFTIHTSEDAIIDALELGETRYILGIPLILERAEIDYTYLLDCARKSQKKLLSKLLEIIYIASKIIQNKEKKEILERIIFKKKIKLSYKLEEFEEIYEQYSQNISETSSLPVSINYQLSFLFAKKQIEIISKLKSGKRLTKTEKEYYSRVIKKKLVAIKELNEFVKGIVVRD
ncbi:MAG: hypothetical protein AABX38_05460 [Candidatus Micrarchaeota archaeon]